MRINSEWLADELISADDIESKLEQRNFVERIFIKIHSAYKVRLIDNKSYTTLCNQLRTFKNGYYDDYIDLLVGATSMGLLGLAHTVTPEQATANRDDVTVLADIIRKAMEMPNGETG